MKFCFRFRKSRAGRFLCNKLIGPVLLCFLLPGPIFAGGRGEAAAPSGSVDGRLTVIFMNDTHSHLYPWKDEQNGREYGGAARWATVIKNIRREAENTLFLHTLIRCRLPEKAMAQLEAFAKSRSAGYTLRKSGRSPSGAFFTAVMDLPSWIDLYREGSLTGDYQYESLEREIIEVLLK
jgi:hypothetical protein